MPTLDRVRALLEVDSEASFAELVELIEGPSTPPGTEALLRDPALDGALLLAAVVRSRVVEQQPYTAHSPHPFDYRSRMLVQALLSALGHRHHEPARALVVGLLRHPEGYVSTYAAHALTSFGDAQAIDAMASAIGHIQGTALSVALRAMVAFDPKGVYDRLAPWLDPSARPEKRPLREILPAVLWILDQDFKWNRELRVMEATRGWFGADSRWLDVALRVASDGGQERALRSTAKDLVSNGDRAKVKAAKQRLGIGSKPTKGKPKKPTKAEREAALAAARAAMAPVRSEIVRIVAALECMGYRFVRPNHALVAPAGNVMKRLTALEKRVGPLPAMVRAFYELVGAIDLSGSHPAWARTGSLELAGATEPVWQTDPLVVLPLEVAEEEAGEWTPDEDPELTIPFALPLIPEPLAKLGYSAGPPFAVLCGATAPADPPLEAEPSGRTFAQHLRGSIDACGLPGFSAIADAPIAWLDELKRRATS